MYNVIFQAEKRKKRKVSTCWRGWGLCFLLLFMPRFPFFTKVMFYRLFLQEGCKLSWSWLENGFPCFFHNGQSRELQAIRENKVKERWNIFDTKSVLKTSQLRWHERTSVQMQTSYSSLCKTSYGLFSGGWVHSDYFNRAERSNGDTNRGEVSNGSNIAQLNLTQPDTTYGPIPAWFLKPLLFLEVKKTLFC